MKKRLLLPFLAVCTFLCACGESNKENVTTQATTTNVTTEKSTKVTTEKKTEPTTIKEQVPFYIGSVRQQYDEANKELIFFWQFQDVNKKTISAKAKINIYIKNDKGEEIFNKDFEVDKNNYSMWSNKLNSTSQLLGSISVNVSDLNEGGSTKGVATITASTANASFEPVNITVNNLPQKGITVNIPELPVSSNSFNYNGELKNTMTVTDISYEYEWRLKINVTAQMTYNSSGDDARDYGRVGYKITNENGMVVDSGYMLFDQLSVGESQIKQIYVSDAEPGDNLNLTIIDVD